jgi:hypothetical protein
MRRRKPDLLLVLALIAGIGVVVSTRAENADAVAAPVAISLGHLAR